MVDNLKKKWYIQTCNSGKRCWCRIIVSDKKSDDMEDCIAPSGSLSKDVAKHIVKLHNDSLKKK